MFKTNMVDIIKKELNSSPAVSTCMIIAWNIAIIIRLTRYSLGYVEHHSKIYADWAKFISKHYHSKISEDLATWKHEIMKTLNIYGLIVDCDIMF